jgi:hypothetical protein
VSISINTASTTGAQRDTFGLSNPNLKDLKLKGPLPELLA